MLAELIPTNDNVASIPHLAEIMRAFSAGKGFHHPVLDYCKSNGDNGPTLYFDMQRIEERMQWLGEVTRPLAIAPLLAVKSCPDAHYLEVAQRMLCGFDVSNSTEYESLHSNLDGKLISVTSPELSINHDSFTSRGNATVITVDSQVQLNQFVSQNTQLPYVLRIQGSDLLKDLVPADAAYFPESRFGFTLEEVGQVLQQPAVKATPPSGFHVHHGSEENQVSTFTAMIQGLKLLADTQVVEPAFINLGGGWDELTREEISDVLTRARQAFPSPCSILMEPGRWYSKNAGFAACTVVNQMQSGDTINYTVNLSRECHLRWSRVKLVCPIEASPKKVQAVQFFGPSCYEGDLLGRFMVPYQNDFLHESGLAPGSQVIFSNVSTYSAAWNTSFNGIPRADVSWWRQPQAVTDRALTRG